MMFSLVASGIAPSSFYELDAEGNRQRSHYDGLPVEFIAESISTLGGQSVESFETYHVMNPYDDGLGMDEFIDWLIEAGYAIERIADYRQWIQRFESTLRALPDKQRQASLLPLLHNYQQARDADAGRPGPDGPLPGRSAGSQDRARTRTSPHGQPGGRSSSTSPTCSSWASCGTAVRSSHTDVGRAHDVGRDASRTVRSWHLEI